MEQLKKNNFWVVGIVLLACLITGISLGERLFGHLVLRPRTMSQNTVTYYCREGVVKVTYMDRKVRLILPDGREFVLPQAVAASGTRYSNGRIEFWSKGPNAFVTESNKTIYSDGVAGTVRYSEGTAIFTDSMKSFSFCFPRHFRLSGKGIGFTTDWRAGAVEPGMVLAMVTIPKSYLPKTNFSEARLIIGKSSNPEALKHCFEEPQGSASRRERVLINGVPFIRFAFSDAGAGNLYETVSYRTKHGEECYAVEYTVHSTNIGMYSPDQGIQEFDKAKAFKVLDTMAQSFRLW
jgi:membrane-bound inhibitor of C-type lysozyme